MPFIQSNIVCILINLVSGVLLAFAFAPFEHWWLAILALSVFFKIQLNAAPKVAFKAGFAFGLGLYLAGVSWVYNSLHVYGGMPLWMGAVVVFLFCSLLAMFVALPSFFSALLTQRFTLDEQVVVKRSRTQLQSIFLLISFWLIFEWGKSWVLTGFPWLDVGYTQTFSALFGLAPIGGVYLVSFSLLFTAASFALLSGSLKRQYKGYLAVGIFVIWSGSWLGSTVNWTQTDGKVVQIGVVQPNTPINQKWQANYRDNVIQNLASLSVDLASGDKKKVDLVVWPETALPLFYQQTNTEFWQKIAPQSVAVLTGIMDSPDYENSYNAAVLYCDGDQHLYRKQHLVPFGEYMPLRFLFGWVLDYLQLPMSDLGAWSEPQSLSCGESLNVGLSICYEDAFSQEHRISNHSANILVNISEDAWFGDSFAPHQRLQMGQFRARELAKPMVRSANSGPSAFIDHLGRVQAKTGQFETATMSRAVQPRQGRTPFSVLGNWIIWLAISFVLLVCYSMVKVQNHK